MKLKARAKINLSLDVVGKRENGYHDLEMVMQTIALHDFINLTPNTSKKITLTTNVPWLPTSHQNIAYKAAELLFSSANLEHSGVHIEIIKQIPSEAGLAGGSADAAAVLIGLNRLFHIDHSKDKLKELGLSLGADVPFCIEGGTCLAEGIGERLTPLEPMPRTFVVLVKPPFGASTASIFRALNFKQIQEHPNTEALLQALRQKDVKGMAPYMVNVLEEVTFKLYPELDMIKQKFKHYGAFATLMSGSGSVVFGLFEDEKTARQAVEHFNEVYQHVYLTTTYN